MKRKAKLSITKTLRIGIACSLFLIIIVTAFYFMTRSREHPKYPRESKEITQQRVEKREQIVHSEVRGERENFRMRADKHYVGEDDKNHLEGKVEIIDFGQGKDQNVFIYGEEVIYDKDLNHFVLKGQSTVKYRDLIIESNFFDYYKNREVFKSSKGVRFSSRKLLGSAEEMVYFMRQERLVLRRRVRLHLTPESEDTLPLIVEGNRLHYSREKKVGEVVGRVRLSQGKSWASAHVLEFILSEDEETVKSITLRGRVRASIVERENGESGRREINADEIKLDRFMELSRVSRIEARRNCRYNSSISSGSSIFVQGESFDFLFNREGELERFDASENVRMVEHMENFNQKRFAVGAEMSIQGKTNILQIRGSDDLRARVTTQDSEIFSEEITIHLENDNLEAKGRVKVVFKGGEGKESLGFFSEEQPVFISAQEMRYMKAKKRFLFNKDIKVWQGKEMLLAEELSLLEETGEIICSGGVKSVFFHKLKEKKEEERIEISADKMNFNPKKSIIVYEEKSSLQVRDLDLRAQSISVHLEEEGGGMKTIVAQGGVKIVQEATEGRGEKAEYDLENEAITLTGEPVVIDKDRGMTRGDKLTFYMADGRITVENKDGERSVTVIKS